MTARQLRQSAARGAQPRITAVAGLRHLGQRLAAIEELLLADRVTAADMDAQSHPAGTPFAY
ncbi:hypothetical protein [Streptomyces sp. 3N207]|uniref:hypothetical protein n=1 Tax=Streptomyces sp. 3N207 TaxID=3457417 RepID=UPI003FD41E1B